MRRIAAAVIGLISLTCAVAAHALAPGDLYVVSGAPGENAFLPGRSNASSLEEFPGGSTSSQRYGNTHKVSDDGRYVVFVSGADALVDGDDDAYSHVYRKDLSDGSVDLVDVPAPGGSTVGHASRPAMSGDGSVIAFQTSAALLAADTDGGQIDVYVRDLDAQTTELISSEPGGQQGDGNSVQADISQDGNVVAFATTVASVWDPLDTDAADDVYRYVRSTDTLQLMSVNDADTDDAATSAEEPAVDGDGDRVAFHTTASNIDGIGDPDPNTDTEQDIYLRTAGGATILISRASAPGSAKGNDDSMDPAISADGTVVAFASRATNLDPADVESGQSVYARQGANTFLISRASGAGANANNGFHGVGTIAEVGGDYVVAFRSRASNLNPPQPMGEDELRAYTRTLGGAVTTLVSRGDGGAGDPVGIAGDPGGAWEGPAVAFNSFDGGIASAADDDVQNVYLRDGAATRLVSIAPPGVPWLGGSTDSALVSRQSVSADGRYVLFSGDSAAYLPPGFDPGWQLLLVRDLVTGRIEVASRGDGADGEQARGIVGGALSPDGRRVAFVSYMPLDGQTPDDDRYRIHVRDLDANTTRLVTVGAGGMPTSHDSDSPVFSGDGTRLVFESRANNLPGHPGDGDPHVFVIDAAGGDPALVDRKPDGTPANGAATSPWPDRTGNRIGFASTATNLAGDDNDPDYTVYVRDLAANTTTVASLGPGGAPNLESVFDFLLSGDGARVAYGSSEAVDAADADGQRDVYVRDLGSTDVQLATPGTAGSISTFNADPGFHTLAVETYEALDPADDASTPALYLRPFAGGPWSPGVRTAQGVPILGGTHSASFSGDGACMAFTVTGPDEYGEGPVPGLGLAGTEPSPDHQYVAVQALTEGCAPAPPGPGPPPPGGSDTQAPVVSDLAMTRRRFARRRAATAISAAKRKRAKKGTAFRFSLSEPATVRIAFAQRRPGRRVKGRCRKPTAKLRTRKRCARWVKRGALTRAGLPAGATRIAFTGTLGKRAFRPGRYRAAVVATDAAGNASAAQRVRFRVVRR